MRIAFYAPLKSPAHPMPSGDRRVARLYVDALQLAGHTVDLASELRSHEPHGDPLRQERLRLEGEQIAASLVQRWRGDDAARRPAFWFTYHLYYKAPDWIGPLVSHTLGIPYVVAEASFAAKRASGAWAKAHHASLGAIRAANLLLCPTRDDMAGLVQARGRPTGIEFMPPFLDPEPYRKAAAARVLHRADWSRRFDLAPEGVWIAVAAMMRHGDKLQSYRMLAEVLTCLGDVPVQLLVAGAGAARTEVQALLRQAAPGRVHFAGQCTSDEMAALYAACDLCVWPAVNEAYGMAMLEAQAAGLAVVSSATRGVPDVVRDGETGLLAPAGDVEAMARHLRSLLHDVPRRQTMGRAAASFVFGERSIAHAARTIDTALRAINRPMPPNPGGRNA